MPTRIPVEERFWNKVERTDYCWNWLGCVTGKGYGTISLGGSKYKGEGKIVSAHRYSYESLVGNINGDLVIDHLCRNKRCVNPEHLEQVTRGENVLRGHSPSAILYRINKCKAGHSFTKANTYRTPVGNRQCRTCNAARARLRRKLTK